jgi:hypothetical protein
LKANGLHAGSTLQSNQPFDVTIEGQIDARDPIAAIEIVQNGRIEQVRSLPATVRIEESGWFLIRVRSDVPNTFRFASTAPWYVEVGGKKPAGIRSACEFFRQWTEERIDQLRQKLASEQERREVLPVFEAASQFWADQAAKADSP